MDLLSEVKILKSYIHVFYFHYSLIVIILKFI
jgi:hypothetical protein